MGVGHQRRSFHSRQQFGDMGVRRLVVLEARQIGKLVCPRRHAAGRHISQFIPAKQGLTSFQERFLAGTAQQFGVGGLCGHML